MAEYIDKQKALAAIEAEREYMTKRQEWLAEHILTHCGYRIIADMPSADVVPVVRCKDCRFSDWYTAGDGKQRCYCMEHGSSGHEENDYCSYGARMEGEQDG